MLERFPRFGVQIALQSWPFHDKEPKYVRIYMKYESSNGLCKMERNLLLCLYTFCRLVCKTVPS